jgi:hemerythrin
MTRVSEDLWTGIPQIDQQHQRLLAEVGALLAGKPLPESLDILREHFSDHFSDEEAWAEHVGYPGILAHRRAHLSFFDTFIRLRARWLKTQGAEELHALVDALLMWVKEHVLKEDLSLVRWVRDNQKGDA